MLNPRPTSTRMRRYVMSILPLFHLLIILKPAHQTGRSTMEVIHAGNMIPLHRSVLTLTPAITPCSQMIILPPSQTPVPGWPRLKYQTMRTCILLMPSDLKPLGT